MTSKASFFFIMVICVFSCKEKIDYYNVPMQSENSAINAIIEIPAGTNKKYEYNTKTKSFEIDQKNGVDRIVEYLPYLGNYGYIPSTYSDPKKGGDGDAIDVLVISESVPTATILEITPIAILKLIDNGELDYKIIATPYKKADRIIKANSYEEFSKKYPEIKYSIEMWFLNYNKADEARVEGWGDEAEALKEIQKNNHL